LNIESIIREFAIDNAVLSHSQTLCGWIVSNHVFDIALTKPKQVNSVEYPFGVDSIDRPELSLSKIVQINH